MQWLQNLDIGLSYKGEGLANLTYKVLNKLLKKKFLGYRQAWLRRHLLLQLHLLPMASGTLVTTLTSDGGLLAKPNAPRRAGHGDLGANVRSLVMTILNQIRLLVFQF